MKCSEAERRIYLYRELSASEKNETDVHLEDCSQCQQLFKRVEAMQKVIAAQDVPRLSNHAHMTRRIMDVALETRKKQPDHRSERSSTIFHRLRYVMAALSVFLIVFFAAEYAKPESGTIVKQIPVVPGQTQFNLTSFHTAFFEARANNRRVPRLISLCVTKCVHADCTDCPQKFKDIN